MNPSTVDNAAPVDRMRASDAEREHVAARLADHLAAGRLDVVEFGARLDQVFAARTRGELAPVLADLPEHEPAPAPRTPRYGARRGTGRALRRAAGPPAPRAAAPVLAMIAAVVVLATTLAVVTGSAHYGPFPWILVPLFFVLRRRLRRST